MNKSLNHHVFEVTVKTKTHIKYNSVDEMKLFPTHEEHLTEVQKRLIIYEFKPGANFNENDHVQFIQKKLKAKYNAHSVVYLGQKVEELTLKQ